MVLFHTLKKSLRKAAANAQIYGKAYSNHNLKRNVPIIYSNRWRYCLRISNSNSHEASSKP
jgi:hypothetical protein